MIVSFKNYYWMDTLAELHYHPPGMGGPECWVDITSQTYAISYKKSEMNQMLKDGLITEHMGGQPTVIRDVEPFVKPTTKMAVKTGDVSDYMQFKGEDVVVKMSEGYEIFGTFIDIEPDSKHLVLVEIVVYPKDEPMEIGEAALIDPKHIVEIREMSPEERQEWIEDYTSDLADEEIKQVMELLEQSNAKSKKQNAKVKTKEQEEPEKKVAEIAKTKKEYTTDLTNTDVHPDQLVDKMRIAQKKEDCPALTLLFHGQPGTSKTQTAKYIAHKLGKKLKSYNLGEIMSKWVGETEKKINEIFEDAKKDGHVVLIDEIEGLTQDRSGAEKSWQMTHVNAFLQAIDEFDGIVICTTNFTDKMDKAFLRRFLLKAEFKNLTAEQAKKAAKKFFPKLRFRKEFEGDTYAPADFANVKNGFLFLEEKDITVKYVQEQLEKEAKTRAIKDKGSSACMDDLARMGFSLKRK